MIWPFKPRPPVIGRLLLEHAAQASTLHASSFANGWSVQEFERLIRDPTSEAQSAVDGRTCAFLGFVLSRVAADEAEILSIAVDGKERGRGIGQALLDAHIAAITARGVRRLFLEVDEHNTAATALYARRSFRNVGERKAYYRKPDGTAATAIVMLLTLD